MSLETPPTISTPSTPLAQVGASVFGGAEVITRGHFQPVLPNPSTFDVLPFVHELVNRVLLSDNLNSVAAATEPRGLGMQSNHQPIPVHQLAAEISTIKNRIRKARVAVEALPGTGIHIQQQESEIKELETRIAKQKRALVKLNMND